MAKRGALASAFDNPESIGLLTAGLGILANNNGHYGQFGPAFGKGALMGLETYLPLAQQKRDEQRRKAALEGLINIGNRKPVAAIPAGKPQRQTFPGQTPDFNPMAKESAANISLNEIVSNPAEAFKLPMEQIEGSLPTSVTQGINLDGGEEQPQLGPSAPGFSFGMPQDSSSPIAPNLETEIGALQQKKQAAYGSAMNAANAALAMQPQGIGALNSAMAMNKQQREQPQQPQPNIGNQVASASPGIDRATLEALAAHAEATGDYSMFNAAMQQQIFPQQKNLEFLSADGTVFALDKQTGQLVHSYEGKGRDKRLSDLGTMYAEMNQLPVEDVQGRQYYQNAIAKLTAQGGGGAAQDHGSLLEAAGVKKGTPQYQQMMLEYAQRKGSGMQTVIQNYPAPTPVVDPRTGEIKLVQFGNKGDVIETPYRPYEKMTPEAAGRVSMLQQAQKDIQGVYGLIFTPDGALNRSVIAGAGVPGTAGVGENARLMRSRIYNAIAAKLRVETGAAAPAAEVEDIAKRFMPGLLDNAATARDKLQRLEEFISSALDLSSGVTTHQRQSAPQKQRKQAQPMVEYQGKKYYYEGTHEGMPAYRASDGSQLLDR